MEIYKLPKRFRFQYRDINVMCYVKEEDPIYYMAYEFLCDTTTRRINHDSLREIIQNLMNNERSFNLMDCDAWHDTDSLPPAEELVKIRVRWNNSEFMIHDCCASWCFNEYDELSVLWYDNDDVILPSDEVLCWQPYFRLHAFTRFTRPSKTIQ